MNDFGVSGLVTLFKVVAVVAIISLPFALWQIGSWVLWALRHISFVVTP